jgi:hypothetical protein
MWHHGTAQGFALCEKQAKQNGMPQSLSRISCIQKHQRDIFFVYLRGRGSLQNAGASFSFYIENESRYIVTHFMVGVEYKDGTPGPVMFYRDVYIEPKATQNFSFDTGLARPKKWPLAEDDWTWNPKVLKGIPVY